MRARGAWCVGLLGLVPGSALAQEPATAPPTYALSWVRAEGAEACPAAHALAAEVERRLGRPVFDAKAQRSIEVDVMRFGDKYRSDVYVRDASGRALGHRQLESDEPGCGALLSATALAVALVIDPDAASREPPPSPPPGKASFEPVPAPPQPAPPPPPPVVLNTTAKTGPVRPPVIDVEAFVKRMIFADVALGGTYNLGLVPNPAWGARLSVSARTSSGWGFSLSADYVAAQNRTLGIGSLDVGLTRGSVLLAYFLAYNRDAHLWVGLGPTLGAFHVGVRSPAPVTDSGDFVFGAAELGMSGQLHVFKRLFLHVGMSGLVAPRRQEFLVRGQSEPVWRQPAVAGSAFLGVGTYFP